MLFYIVILIGLFLSISDRKIISAKVYAMIITLVAIFRYGCGADYFSYYYLYDKLEPSFIKEIVDPSISQEIGFRLIGVPFKMFNAPYQVYLAMFAIVSIYFLYRTSIKYSKNPTFSLVIYFAFYYVYWTYSSLRQGTVMAIGIYYLLQAIFDKKEAKFIIITLLLTTIHESALFLLVLYLVSKINFNKKTLLILLSLSIGISIVPLGSIINKLADYIPVFARVAYYVDTTSFTLGNILDFQTVGRLAFLFVAFFFYDEYCNESDENKKIMNIYIFSFVIYFAFKFSELTAARLAVYGKVLDILILANIISTIKVKWNKYVYISLVIMFMYLYIYKDLSSMEVQASLIDNHDLYTPYINVFNKDNYIFNSRYIEIIFDK